MKNTDIPLLTILYYAIYDESNIGYIFYDGCSKMRFGILHASVLRGSHFNALSNPLFISPVYSLREATEQDFKDYRVSLPPDFHKLNNNFKQKQAT